MPSLRAPALPFLLAVGCAMILLSTMFWPGLAAASDARPDTLGSVALDGILCFGPLGAPLLAMGGVVVWLEQRS